MRNRIGAALDRAYYSRGGWIALNMLPAGVVFAPAMFTIMSGDGWGPVVASQLILALVVVANVISMVYAFRRGVTHGQALTLQLVRETHSEREFVRLMVAGGRAARPWHRPPFGPDTPEDVDHET